MTANKHWDIVQYCLFSSFKHKRLFATPNRLFFIKVNKQKDSSQCRPNRSLCRQLSFLYSIVNKGSSFVNQLKKKPSLKCMTKRNWLWSTLVSKKFLFCCLMDCFKLSISHKLAISIVLFQTCHIMYCFKLYLTVIYTITNLIYLMCCFRLATSCTVSDLQHHVLFKTLLSYSHLYYYKLDISYELFQTWYLIKCFKLLLSYILYKLGILRTVSNLIIL